VVCKGFLHHGASAFYSTILKAFKCVIETPQENVIHRLLPSFSVPYFFLTKIEEYNSIFGQHQIENIHYTLSLMESNLKTDKLEIIIKNNIQKCIQWCIKHGVQYNILFRDMVATEPV
jgi:hypothetical protein